MTHKQIIELIKSFPFDVPLVVTWRDAVDCSEEISRETLGDLKEVIYETIGYYIDFKDDYIVLGYNKEQKTHTYKGYGYIPSSLIITVDRFSNKRGVEL